MADKIKVCLPTGTRADFPRIEPVLELLVKDRRFEVKVAVTGAHLLKSHGSTCDYLRDRYGDIVCEFDMFQDPPNDTPLGTSNAFAKCAVGFASMLDMFRPDVCLITVDRVETLAFASVAALMNYPILHVQGGEISGTIDENIRHAVSKLSQVHSVANNDARLRLVQMGEAGDHVFDTGCPYSKMLIEVAESNQRSNIVDKFLLDNHMSRPYSIFCLHPVTTDSDQNGYGRLDLPLLISALQNQGSVVVLTPNSDLGFSYFERALSNFSGASIFQNINPEIYLPLLCEAHALVGNSSSGIRESCYFGTPVINIGDRQQGRLSGGNVKHCAADTHSALKAISDVFSDYQRYLPEYLYGDQSGASRIVDILANTDWAQVSLAKKFNDMRV